MTNHRAIGILKNIKAGFEKDEWMADDVEALDKGIEALENQKIGHWIDDGKYGTSCSICSKWYNHPYLTKEEVIYCCRCGAKMEGE